MAATNLAHRAKHRASRFRQRKTRSVPFWKAPCRACPGNGSGARTGLAAGAVPHGGHILNTSRMNRYLGLRRDEQGQFLLRVEPGVVLSELRKQLSKKVLPTAGWDQASLEAYEEFQESPEQFFPTDPTEASACLGGMAACNASGARSYAYGPMRPHITGLHVALADGDLLELQRGEAFAQDRHLSLVTAAGRTLELDLPGYTMPETKNASGYFVADDMDAIDLFIGACGTLGVITELEIALQAAPSVVWGVSCFFDSEDKAVSFTDSVRPVLSHAAAIEYFDAGALDILRRQREQSTACLAAGARRRGKVCVYVELDCDDEAQATEELYHLDGCWSLRAAATMRHGSPAPKSIASASGSSATRCLRASTCLSTSAAARIPLSPSWARTCRCNACLADVMALYRRTLAESGLESAAWGHIGNNHLHVNILPRDAQDYRRGGELFAQWASEVTAMGGAVSAEHGVGKIKAGFLETMYGHEAMVESARLKLQLDPAGQLGRGNLFTEKLLDELVQKGGA